MMKHPWKSLRCPRVGRQGMKLVALVAIACMAGDARAQIFVDYTWNNPNGGSYHTFGNWTPSSGFGGIPDSDNEGAVFNLDANYTVMFPTNVATNSAIVRDGALSFDLGSSGTARTYTLNSLTVSPTDESTLLDVRRGTVSLSTLRIAEGGVVITVLDGLVDVADGSTTVTDFGSVWAVEDGFLRVGQNGTGTLTISNRGRVQNQDGTSIGRFPGSNGTVTVTGDDSLLDISANLAVGQEGSGTLLVEDGGVVSSTTGRVASSSGDATGEITVTGEGSAWNLSGDFLRIGEMGDATLMIEDGGSVESRGASIGTTRFPVEGGTRVGRGTVILTGEDSTWTSNGTLVVGEEGVGELTISNGAQCRFGSSIIGFDEDSNGRVRVTGEGSIWSGSGNLTVGSMSEAVDFQGSPVSRATLRIEDGGRVENREGVVGSLEGAFGLVTVSGGGSSWSNREDLIVGHVGEGMLEIVTGGRVESAGGVLGSFAGSTGTVNVAFDSIWTTTGRVSIGGNADFGSNGGAGTLRISGGTVDVTDDTVVFPDGLVRLQSGTFSTTAISFEGGGEFLWTGGTLHVGDYHGDLTNPSGGTLAPGRSAGGTTVLGDYTQQSGATLQIEIGGTATATEHDFVDVNGNALVGGSLELALIEDFIPAAEDEFIVFNADDLSGNFSNAGNGQRVDTIDGIGSFLVHYGPASMFIERQNQIVLTDFEFAGLPGDFDLDGDVDGQDFLKWQRGESPNPLSQADLADWQTNYGGGTASAANATTVPEPSASISLVMALACSMFVSTNRTPRRSPSALQFARR